jgi:hypothetical protein
LLRFLFSSFGFFFFSFLRISGTVRKPNPHALYLRHVDSAITLSSFIINNRAILHSTTIKYERRKMRKRTDGRRGQQVAGGGWRAGGPTINNDLKKRKVKQKEYHPTLAPGSPARCLLLLLALLHPDGPSIHAHLPPPHTAHPPLEALRSDCERRV